MAENSLLVLLIVGAVSGWLAGLIVDGYGFGIIGNIVVGIIGAFFGDWLFTHFHVLRELNLVHTTGVVSEILGATFGAVVLLFLLRLVRRTA